MESGLFQNWLSLEKAEGRPMKTILAELNAACGTKYDRTWPNVVAGRNFGIERCPTSVRRYMMGKVLKSALEANGLHMPDKKLLALIVNLT